MFSFRKLLKTFYSSVRSLDLIRVLTGSLKLFLAYVALKLSFLHYITRRISTFFYDGHVVSTNRQLATYLLNQSHAGY